MANVAVAIVPTVIGTTTLVDPAGTDKLAPAAATLLSEVMANSTPPVGAAPVRVTVALTFFPLNVDVGATVMLLKIGARTFKVAVNDVG